MSRSYLPHFMVGPVVKGFGRGSKELGCSTANFDSDVVKGLPKDVETGVFFGWAKVDNDEVRKAVLSIGWNPFYENKEKSVETHIIHKFPNDLYGQTLRLCICGYLRPQLKFNSLDELIKAINDDIDNAKKHLDEEPFHQYKSHQFFQEK